LLINAARGGIVDEEALRAALDSGQVGGAALDVFVEEPPPKDHPLVDHPHVICTPHLGASTDQAQINVSVAVAEQVRDYLLDGVVRNSINVPSVSPEQMGEMAPYVELGVKLGRFQGQLAMDAVCEVEITYAGDIAERNVDPITVAVMKGLLESSKSNVNLVNALVLAKERGIKFSEKKVTQSEDFASAVTVVVRCTGGADGNVERLISGAVFHGNQARIVRIDDFMMEAIPEGPTLLLHNRDQTGVVGTVGTILGDEGINISRMQLALVPQRKEAAMLVNVDSLPSEKVLERLREVPNMITAQLVEL
jgi:D-3-phosphoglycerate dehydrogenase